MATQITNNIGCMHDTICAYIPALQALQKHAYLHNMDVSYGCDKQLQITATFTPKQIIHVPEGLLLVIREEPL